MSCMFGLPVDSCCSCEAFDYCTEYADIMSYIDYLKMIKKGDDNNGIEESCTVRTF